jgi:hypothetical protein
MRPATATDHGTLALLAQNPAAELRPLLLRVHVQGFAAAPRRDAPARASFEAIALGLIPLVTDDVLADIAGMLRGLDDVPERVWSAIEARLLRRPGEPERRASLATPPVAHCGDDVALARDLTVSLDGEALTRLIERAIRDPRLARALLARPEPTIFDRAALYRHADENGRALIRQRLAAALSSIHVPRPLGESEAARQLLRISGHGNVHALLSALAARLDVDLGAFDLDEPAGQELVLFAMLAIGLSAAECVRTFLMLDAPLAKSVPTVFRLAELARTTSRPVAAFLAGYERVVPGGRKADAASSTARIDGRPGTRSAPRRANPAAPDQYRDARADRRS